MKAVPLEIHLFGPFSARVRGEPVPRMRTRSVEWLLALLALRHGHAVSRSWLAGTLWPESDERQARCNLRNDLLRLRKALGPEAERLQATHDTLSLDLAGADVDVLRFDRGMRAGDAASLRNAVAAYAGPLLEDCHTDWIGPERAVREQACLGALEKLADEAEELGEFAESLELLSRVLAIDGLRGTAIRQRMRVLAAAGDTPAALMTYRDHRVRLHDEANAEPDTETTRAFREFAARSRPPAPDARAQSSPVRYPPPPHPLTELIGREQDAVRIAREVAGFRLVTLVGPGGIGKTRLAIHAAAVLGPNFASGAPFVTLAPLASPQLLPALVASHLGIAEPLPSEPEKVLDAVVSFLTPHKLLLILDNCEHLTPAAAAMAQTLLERCPGVRILATSRERLRVNGEKVLTVPPLAVPGEAVRDDATREELLGLLDSPAARLFVERAALVRPEFRPSTPNEALAIVQICRRLDGIPLAIELAAARMNLLSARQIADRLDDRFRLLVGGSRGALPQHQTLRASIDWSYDLLDDQERALLRRLAVFADGWTLAAAEAMAHGFVAGAAENGPENSNEEDVLEVLASLLDHSLVAADETGAKPRYRMLETIREYALRRLVDRGEESAARELHLTYFVGVAEGLAPRLRGPENSEALGEVEAETANFRSALERAHSGGGVPAAALRLTAALWPFWEIRGHQAEGMAHLRLALALPEMAESRERAEALLGAAMLAFAQIERGAATDLAQQSLERFRAVGDPRGIAACLILLGHASMDQDPVCGRAQLEEALEYTRRCDWAQGSALAAVYLGLAMLELGQRQKAVALLEEGRELAAVAGDNGLLALAFHTIGFEAMEAREWEKATRFLERSRTLWRDLGHLHKASWSLRCLGHVARIQGDPELAVSCYEETAAICRAQGNRSHLAIALHALGNVLYERQCFEAARRAYAEALQHFKVVETGSGFDCVANHLGSTLSHLGESEAARSLHQQALRAYQARGGTGGAEGAAWSMERLAFVDAQAGDLVEAARLLGAAAALRERAGFPVLSWDQADRDHAATTAREGLDQASFDAAWAAGVEAGRDLPLPDAPPSRACPHNTLFTTSPRD